MVNVFENDSVWRRLWYSRLGESVTFQTKSARKTLKSTPYMRVKSLQSSPTL